MKTCTDKDGVGDGKIIAVRHYDGLGQLRLSRQLEAGTAADCNSTSEAGSTAGIKVKRGYRWEAGGHYEVASNPYINSGESTMGWTLTRFDDSGRVSTVERYAGDALPGAPNGSNNTIRGERATATMWPRPMRRRGSRW